MIDRSGSGPLIVLLLVLALTLATPKQQQGTPATTGEETSGMETIATLTVDGKPYTFVGVRGGSVLSDDFYCFVGLSPIIGMFARLALEGDDGSELRFTFFLDDEEDPFAIGSKSVTAELPQDFDHTLNDGGQEADIAVQRWRMAPDFFTVKATVPLVENVSGDEHNGILDASC